MNRRTRAEPLSFREELFFLATNRLPRITLGRFMGWFGKIEQPLVRDLSLGAWKRLSALELEDAARSDFKSVHDCFTRELRPGARPIDPSADVLVSPCDGIVGGHGEIADDELIQAKGFPYRLGDLLPDPELVERYRDGLYVTLRLTASMYHRFHAPDAGRVRRVTYVSGDTWNTHPVALRRIEKLYCKNERAIIEMTLDRTGHQIALAAVAAVLVACLRFRFLDARFHPRYAGPEVIPCDTEVLRGEELGHFEHGSTIIVFAPRGFRLAPIVGPGRVIRMGQPLLQVPAPASR